MDPADDILEEVEETGDEPRSLTVIHSGVPTKHRSLVTASSTIIHGITSAVKNPMLQYGLLTADELGEATVAGIKNLPTGQWLLNVDKSHMGISFPHISINSYLTGNPDPQLPVSEGFLSNVDNITQILAWIGSSLRYASIALDVYRLGNAFREDYNGGHGYEGTLTTAMSILAANIGGHIGSLIGSILGEWIGGEIGGFFGWVGKIIGSIVGSLIGGFIGAILGAQYLSKRIEAIVCNWYSGNIHQTPR